VAAICHNRDYSGGNEDPRFKSAGVLDIGETHAEIEKKAVDTIQAFRYIQSMVAEARVEGTPKHTVTVWVIWALKPVVAGQT
jgi:hypothetical protein